MSGAEQVPSASTSVDGEAKRKRKQLSSCDACRLRRIRCIRESADQICETCREKNIHCTSDYISTRPKVQRTGKRIEAAKQQFGSGTLPITDSTSSSSAYASASNSTGHRDMRNFLPSTALDSLIQAADSQRTPASIINGKLSEAAIARTLGKHLVECFHEVLLHQCPSLPWDDFYRTCVENGFEAHAFSNPEFEVLCLCIQSLGARVSDHPMIIGNGGPKRNNLPKGVDLTEYCRRREGVCRYLFEKALHIFDIRGIARITSNRAVITLNVLNWLAQTNPEICPKERIFMALALQHLRSILERPKEFGQEETKEALSGKAFWAVFIGESLLAAQHRRLPIVTMNDMKLWAPALLTKADPAAEIDTDEIQVLVAFAAVRVFGTIAMIARQVAEEITSPAAQFLPTSNPATPFLKAWEALDEHETICQLFRDRIKTTAPEGTGYSAILEMWLRAISCCRVDIVCLLDTVLREKVALAEQNRGRPSELVELLAESDRRCLSTIRYLSHALQASENQNQGMAFGGFLLKTIITSTQKLFTLYAKEEGGYADWPLSAKIADIESLLNTMKVASYAWPTGHQIHQCDVDLQELKNMSHAPNLNHSSSSNHAISTLPFSSLESPPAYQALNAPAQGNDPFDSFLVPAMYPASYDFQRGDLNFTTTEPYFLDPTLFLMR